MKSFKIFQWSTSALHPTETDATVEVSEPVGNTGIVSKQMYQFRVVGRFDRPSVEFLAAAGAKLLEAGLLSQAELDTQLAPTEAPGSSAG